MLIAAFNFKNVDAIRKVPKIKDLVVVQGPKPPNVIRAPDSNIHVWIYKMCDQACFLWEDAKGISQKLSNNIIVPKFNKCHGHWIQEMKLNYT